MTLETSPCGAGRPSTRRSTSLSPDGVTWGVVAESVTEHNVVDDLDRLFRAADMPVVISPHYYFPHDHR